MPAEFLKTNPPRSKSWAFFDGSSLGVSRIVFVNNCDNLIV
jgi:hypothetical protein